MRGVLVGLFGTALCIAAGCADSTIDQSGPAVTGGVGGSANSAGTTTGSNATSAATTSGSGGTSGAGGGATKLTVAQCYADDFVNAVLDGPDYDQFNPTVGSHCMGTNHQDITGVERVVFLGDSVTVGTPPTLSGDYYRNKLTDALVAKFGLTAPNFLWRTVDLFNGTTLMQESGDFASCAKWGARTDDFATTQLPSCFPPSALDKKTLVVLTMGGNDISGLTQDSIDGKSEQELWDVTEAFVDLQRDAIEWLTEPGRFVNGVYVIFGNMFEFTDGTGDVESCDVSGLAGFDEPVPSPEQLADMVIWANEQFIKIAVDTGTDAVFLLEDFCGHGLNADDPSSPCYRGPNSETWFDLTCIHPNPTGHQHVSDMFMAVVNE